MSISMHGSETEKAEEIYDTWVRMLYDTQPSFAQLSAEQQRAWTEVAREHFESHDSEPQR